MKNICVVTGFTTRISGQAMLLNFVHVLTPISGELFLVTSESFINSHKGKLPNKICATGIKRHRANSTLGRIVSEISYQSRIAAQMIRIGNRVDTIVFFIGFSTLIFPMLLARAVRKKTVIIAGGAVTKTTGLRHDFPFVVIVEILKRIQYRLSHRIVTYTESLVKELGLEKHRRKLLVGQRHFLHSSFRIHKKLAERENVVGYVGPINKAKGVANLIKAIPTILSQDSTLRVVIVGGNGELLEEIRNGLNREGLIRSNKVKITGWVPHEEIPRYLNELRLMVFPSSTEGLPNVVLEAMACGTPVLAAPVGSVPDLIKDKETGFILPANSPDCIAEKILEALKCPNLDIIVKNARALIEKDYTYEAAVARYRRILTEI